MYQLNIVTMTSSTLLAPNKTGTMKISDELQKIPRMKPELFLPKVYSLKQVEKNINATNNKKHQLILMLAYGCGLRPGEIINLTFDVIFRERDIIHITGKGSKDRLLSLDPAIIKNLKDYHDEHSSLKTTQIYTHVSINLISKIVSSIAGLTINEKMNIGIKGKPGG